MVLAKAVSLFTDYRRRLTKTDLFLGVEGGDSLSRLILFTMIVLFCNAQLPFYFKLCSFLPKVRMMLTKKYFQLMSVAEVKKAHHLLAQLSNDSSSLEYL